MTKILVIEDEEILRSEIIEWLTFEGYETVGAPDGVDGVNEAFQHHPDLIICDIMMPRLDGHGVLLELRSNPSTAAISFIFLTARAAHDDIRKGMDMGADDYITKPFTRLELLSAIQSRIEKKAALEDKYQEQVKELNDVLVREHDRRVLTTKLVAMFSHDFRTPLSSILSSNSLLRDYGHRLNSERQHMHFNRVEASVRRLIQMLDDMMVVAQMEIGHLEFKPEPMNPEQFFHSIVEEFQFIHSESYNIIYDSQFKADVSADPCLLRQIAVNLISNAVKYSPPGSEVRILLRHIDKDIVFSVQDHGIGILEEDLPRMFQSFQRASNVGAVAGTGLGLAIVQQAVDLHGGSIDLETHAGVGTTMTIKIPIA